MCCHLMEKICYNELERSRSLFHDVQSDDILKSAIKFLEGKGYIVSTDIFDNFIAVRPNLSNGRFDPQMQKYCWCFGRVEL